MDEKIILKNIADCPDGEMLGTPPGFLRQAYATAVEAGHLEVMRAPDATTVIGHRITDSGRAYLAGEATETTPVPPPADPAEEPVPTPEQEPPAPEPASPAPAVTEPPATTEPEAKPTA